MHLILKFIINFSLKWIIIVQLFKTMQHYLSRLFPKCLVLHTFVYLCSVSIFHLIVVCIKACECALCLKNPVLTDKFYGPMQCNAILLYLLKMEINIKQILFLVPSDLFHRFYSMKINFIKKKSFATHFFDNEMCVKNEILDT